MKPILADPLEQTFAGWWGQIDRAQRQGFLIAAVVSLLAFGFEMTNLSLHHDDLVHLMVQAPLVGYYLGRFTHAWLFYYGEGGYFMPLLQMTVSLLLMGAYGLVVCHLWGLRRALDIGLATSIMCVFPYMAQIYQYNSCQVAYPAAHLLAALAVLLSLRARAVQVVLAAMLYIAAFSIYQAVIANAATIFMFWLLSRCLLEEQGMSNFVKAATRPATAALLSVVVGGIAYVAIVGALHIDFDSAQAAGEAFSPGDRLQSGLQLSHAASQVVRGTRAFFFWPESYFPGALKKLQLVLVVGAALYCLWLPRGTASKVAAVAILVLAVFAPRILQFVHPKGHFHSLTLTGYAVVVAGALMVIVRSGRAISRNVSAIAAMVVLAGYVAQCNWISTVNHLNTLAHYSTLTQILARLRSLPDQAWDGRRVAVVGRYDMRTDFPFRPATGVASEFMAAGHMSLLGRLMRDDATFVAADRTMPKAIEFAATRPAWPSPGSVGVVEGMAVVVLSKQ